MISLSIPQVPALQTPRLTLRPLAPRDFEPFAALHAAPHAALMWALPTRAAAWERFLACAGAWVVGGAGVWALADRWSDQFLGHAGFFPAADGTEPDLAVALAAPALGRGLAEEGLRAARDWGRLNGHATPASTVDARNTRALRLAARLGAAETGRLTLSADVTLLRLRHPAEVTAP
jgi:RimJ/RimL family protein N-acetyltransferase